MSRNLCSTNCYYCNGEVKLDEAPREATRNDVGVYYDTHNGYGFAGMILANASCIDCKAKYIAWIDESKCAGYSSRAWIHSEKMRSSGLPFYDLSFRSTFNDEPGIDDMPDEVIVREWVITSRKPWPLCSGGCGSKELYPGSNDSRRYCPACMKLPTQTSEVK